MNTNKKQIKVKLIGLLARSEIFKKLSKSQKKKYLALIKSKDVNSLSVNFKSKEQPSTY